MKQIYSLKQKSFILLISFLISGLAFSNPVSQKKTDDASLSQCNWTVTVQDPFFFGDEVSWELRASNGTVLLSGGGYEGEGYFDQQTIMADDPVEFYISAIGTFGDNKPFYTVANENGIILSGIQRGGEESTFSNLLCSDPAEVEPDLDCIDQFMTATEIEGAYVFGTEINHRLAIDIPVGETGFTVHGIDLGLFIIGDPNIFIDFTLFSDNNGTPGDVILGVGGEVIDAIYIDSAFGADLYDVLVDFSEPLVLESNTRYWLEVTAEADSWEAVTYETIGKGLAVNGTYTNGEWVTDPTSEFVYALYCSDLGTNELNSTSFSYYPNPTKDFINISTDKEIKSVEVYSLDGKRVHSELNLTNKKIDLSNLTPGTYLFKVVLSNNQVETFKAIKK